MKQYLNLVRNVLANGVRKENRTGVDTIGILGAMMQFDMADGFPVVTTKKVAYRAAIAEMLGFLRGYDNAAQFREIGCNVWNANANENKAWLENGNRNGEDDLGRIYGVQARRWASRDYQGRSEGYVDQLKMVYEDLRKGVDNRREIVTHWNPGEMHRMALPPCHLLYQFGIQGNRLCLSMYQRSCDLALGVPFNIVGYSWLLQVMARITGRKPGVFTHFLHDVHIYENHLEGMKEQINRVPRTLPVLSFSAKAFSDMKTLEDLETWVKPEDFVLHGYHHEPAIKYDMAV